MRKILILVTFLTACRDPETLTIGADADANVTMHHVPPDAALDAMAPADAPTACGELGQDCCKTGASCNGGAHADVYCSTGGVCMAPVAACGGEGQACCNPLCDASGACWTWPCEANQECQDGTCMVVPSPPDCGGQDEVCCVHVGTTITFCDLGLDCDGELPDGTRTCI